MLRSLFDKFTLNQACGTADASSANVASASSTSSSSPAACVTSNCDDGQPRRAARELARKVFAQVAAASEEQRHDPDPLRRPRPPWSAPPAADRASHARGMRPSRASRRTRRDLVRAVARTARPSADRARRARKGSARVMPSAIIAHVASLSALGRTALIRTGLKDIARNSFCLLARAR